METTHLASIGFLCTQYHRTYFDVMQTLVDCDVKPILVINLVPHYDWLAASEALEPKKSTPQQQIQGAANHGSP
jgi:hypothetical protein